MSFVTLFRIAGRFSLEQEVITRGILVVSSVRWATDLSFPTFRNYRLPPVHRSKMFKLDALTLGSSLITEVNENVCEFIVSWLI